MPKTMSLAYFCSADVCKEVPGKRWRHVRTHHVHTLISHGGKRCNDPGQKDVGIAKV